MPTDFDALNAQGIAESIALCGSAVTLVKRTGQSNATYDPITDTPGGTTTNYSLMGIISQYYEDQAANVTGRYLTVTVDVSTLPGGVVIGEQDYFIYNGNQWGIARVQDAGLPSFVTVIIRGT